MNRLEPSLLLAMTLLTGSGYAEQNLVSVRVDNAPQVDGQGDDPVWQAARPIVTRDSVANIDITLRSIHTADEIFFLASYPEAAPNLEHKTMLWDAAQQRYRTGPKREDMLVLKWSMEPGRVDLSLSANRPYRADIWFWKAFRTDPVGHADDKMHIYTYTPTKGTKRLLSKSGQRFFLTRPGDAGDSAYETVIYGGHKGDRVPKFQHRTPRGSRADVRAKGHWEDGQWHIELGRRLVTRHDDDIQFDRSQRYQFGVSRFEIAGRGADNRVETPNYGNGDVGEVLFLVFSQ